MKLLWKYLKPQKNLIFISLTLAIIAQLLALTDPIILGKIIDKYASGGHKPFSFALIQQVALWLGLAITIAFLSRLFKAFQEFFIRKAIAKFGMQIFNVGLIQTLKLSYEEFEDNPSGEILSILQKVKTDTEKFANSVVTVIFSSIVSMGFLVWYSITKNGFAILLFIAGVILFGVATGILSKKIKTVIYSINQETNKMFGEITESIRNVELVKSLGLISFEIKRLTAQTQKIYDLEMVKVKQIRVLSFMQGGSLLLLKQFLLFLLLLLVFKNILSTGELITMQFISVNLFSSVQDLGGIIIQFRDVEASIGNFEGLMQKSLEKVTPSPSTIGKLQKVSFNNVHFRHKTAKDNAIDGISFEVEAGQTIAFVGPSGAGKSTLVKLLTGLYSPAHGEIKYNNELYSNINYDELRKQIGLVTQDTQLFASSIKDNIKYVKSDALDSEILEVLHKSSSEQLLKRSSNGIHTLLGENGMKLSGGEKQKVSIARALIRRPQLLIFDEATSSLDSLTEENITNTINTIKSTGDQITVLIAHRLSTVMLADLIYVLEKGKFVEIGTHDELIDNRGLYHALWRQQVGERKVIYDD